MLAYWMFSTSHYYCCGTKHKESDHEWQIHKNQSNVTDSNNHGFPSDMMHFFNLKDSWWDSLVIILGLHEQKLSSTVSKKSELNFQGTLKWHFCIIRLCTAQPHLAWPYCTPALVTVCCLNVDEDHQIKKVKIFMWSNFICYTTMDDTKLMVLVFILYRSARSWLQT